MALILKDKTIEAVKWIAGILDRNNIPCDLLAYKKKLVDDEHKYQMVDIEAVEKYVSDNQGI